VCGSTERSPFVERETFTFVRCSCDLVYKSRDQVPSSQQPPALWNERYTKRRRHRVAKSRRQILDLLNHVAPGPLLDVGCSLGYTMEAAKQLGLDAHGIDVNPDVLEMCRERGFDVEFGDVEGPYPFENDTFRMVIMKHVLEHTPDPRSAIREARRVLAPGGGLFVALPNLDFYRAARSPETHHFFNTGGNQHFVYYATRHLSRLLEQEGLQLARVHPHLWQRHATPLEKLASAALLPLRAVVSATRTRLDLRPEFWLMATQPEATLQR